MNYIADHYYIGNRRGNIDVVLMITKTNRQFKVKVKAVLRLDFS